MTMPCEGGAKQDVFREKISGSNYQKSLFKIVDTLSHKKPNNALPDNTSSQDLANNVGEFCTDKIVKIYENLDIARHDSEHFYNECDDHCHATMDNPAPATPADVNTIAMNSTQHLSIGLQTVSQH